MFSFLLRDDLDQLTLNLFCYSMKSIQSKKKYITERNKIKEREREREETFDDDEELLLLFVVIVDDDVELLPTKLLIAELLINVFGASINK